MLNKFLPRVYCLVFAVAASGCADEPDVGTATESRGTDTDEPTGGGSAPSPTTTTGDPASGGPGSGSAASDGGSGDPSTGQPDPDTGRPDPDPDCTHADDTCDGDKLLTCEGGELVTTLCSQAWCAEHGLGNSLGCGYQNDEPGCRCEQALECFDGESQCVGPDAGQDCIDGTWSEPLSCDTFCQQNGYDLSLSCTQIAKSAVCDCRFACVPGNDEYACSQDGTGIFACENSGAWSQYMDCDDVCVSLGYNGSIGCQWWVEYQQFACNCY